MKYLCFIFAALFSGAAYANDLSTDNSIIDLGVLEGERVAITGPALSVRFGNSVMVKAFYKRSESQIVRATSFLAQCDGKWISHRIHVDIFKDSDSNWNPLEWESKTREAWIEDIGSPVDFVPWLHSRSIIAAPLKHHLKAICEGAIQELPNRLLKIRNDKPKRDKYLIHSIVSGTATRKNDVVEIWQSEAEMLIRKDGRSNKTGNQTLFKGIYDCKNKTIGAYDFIEYRTGSDMPKQPRSKSKPTLESAVPGTHGFNTLQLVCLMYGD